MTANEGRLCKKDFMEDTIRVLTLVVLILQLIIAIFKLTR